MEQVSEIVDSKKVTIDILKDETQMAYQYFKDNNERFVDSIRFLNKTTLTGAEIGTLQQLGKPQMEFNVTSAFVSRLIGEFSKMDPGFSVRPAEDVKLSDPRVIDVTEAHLKAAFTGGDKDDLKGALIKDILGGAFSVAQIYVDWLGPKSFQKGIFVEKCYDPTMTVFDPLAKESHKGDGNFAGIIYPMRKAEAIEKWGKESVSRLDFTRNADGFNWSYKNQNEEILLITEMYRKVKRKVRLYKLANGHCVSKKDYESFIKRWDELGYVEVPPAIVNKRWTTLDTIDRYIFNGDQILEHQETDFTMLPLVFFDGNSVVLREDSGSASSQFTIPYAWHARDAQRMKNFAGQTLCNELENMVQHKFIAPIEAIPENADYQIAYTEPQMASVMLYNSYMDNDPNKPVTPPREINRTPIPPQILDTFMIADKLIQTILGTYDAAMGAQGGENGFGNAPSGKALLAGAMNSNASSMPYMIGFLRGWNRCAQIFVDMLPKYYTTPRTIPVILPDGKHSFYKINSPGGVRFDYDMNALEVTVEAGVNFEVQKQIALEVLLKMMQSSEVFAEFMNTEGLVTLLDNIDIRGVENLKMMAEQFMQQKKQQMQQQQQNMPDPQQIMQLQMQEKQMQMQLEQKKVEIEEQKVEQKREESQAKVEAQLIETQAKAATENKANDIKFIEVMSKIQGANVKDAIAEEKLDAENARTAAELAINAGQHAMAIDKHIKEISEPESQKENE